MYGLPFDPVSRVELCNLQQIAKDLHRNFMEEAWLMSLQPHSEPVTREVTGHRERGGDGDVQAPTRWNKLVVRNPPYEK